MALIVGLYEQNFIFRAFALANIETSSIRSMSPAISCSTGTVASPTSSYCSMDVSKYVFISLSFEKLRSPLATETESVRSIRRDITVLDILSVRLFLI